MIPKSFELLHQRWKVKLISPNEMAWHVLENNLKDDYESPYCGLCDPNLLTIYIRDDLTYEQSVHTFYHELVHALLFTMGLFNRKSHNEQIVDVYGALLAQVMLTWKGEQRPS